MIRDHLAIAAAILTLGACSQTGPAAEEAAEAPLTPTIEEARNTAPNTESVDPIIDKPDRPEFAENAADPDLTAAVQLPGVTVVRMAGVWHLSNVPDRSLNFHASTKGTTSGRITPAGDWPSDQLLPAFWIYTPTGDVTLTNDAGAPVWRGRTNGQEEISSEDGGFNLIRK